ncbi:BURP domain protein RD22 [Arachis hypogaea]|uniref:BURP domain protein RD22 n=1 Tax=Arachis hypogaea TaxID=3818 RepID=UPI000DED6A6F|nr:BURP domain protein RD22 [Arachis hypogaea]
MDYPLLLPIFAILNLVVVATHGGALSPELYWKSVLPTTPMPKAITNILYSAGQARKWKPGHVVVREGGHKNYGIAASETQLHDDPNVAFFFLQKDLHPGTKFNLHFTKTTDDAAAFLPREVADSLPFSSNKVEDVFSKFSVDPQSDEANAIKNTIKECEEPAGIKGEQKYCATSLESMVDFSTSKFGTRVEVVSTEVGKETKLQSYNVAPGMKKISHENKAIVCHKQSYPYAVFYCHKIETTMTFKVPLEGADGSRVKAATICHTDTSQWNPKHLVFQVLKVKPGTPVCHFLPEDNVVWVPK